MTHNHLQVEERGVQNRNYQQARNLLCDGIAPISFKGDSQLLQFVELSEEFEGFNEETVTRFCQGNRSHKKQPDCQTRI